MIQSNKSNNMVSYSNNMFIKTIYCSNFKIITKKWQTKYNNQKKKRNAMNNKIETLTKDINKKQKRLKNKSRMYKKQLCYVLNRVKNKYHFNNSKKKNKYNN